MTIFFMREFQSFPLGMYYQSPINKFVKNQTNQKKIKKQEKNT